MKSNEFSIFPNTVVDIWIGESREADEKGQEEIMSPHIIMSKVRLW